jgi:hypothetical protein
METKASEIQVMDISQFIAGMAKSIVLRIEYKEGEPTFTLSFPDRQGAEMQETMKSAFAMVHALVEQCYESAMKYREETKNKPDINVR